MIGLTRTNGEVCHLHPDEIQRVETSPCTLVHLKDGTKYAVVEDIDEIARRVRECRARAMTHVYRIVDAPAGPPAAAAIPATAALVAFPGRQEG